MWRAAAPSSVCCVLTGARRRSERLDEWPCQEHAANEHRPCQSCSSAGSERYGHLFGGSWQTRSHAPPTSALALIAASGTGDVLGPASPPHPGLSRASTSTSP
ncbi:Lysozyme g [Platysternon megacephalum]|uniref:Lysozyme g n=1 Tax=Platysternon megacephalum TaxID=55544 RepID=A0A4D9EFM9_9SAUR|nr:Lysozyme g [Platysternon megacephalum]